MNPQTEAELALMVAGVVATLRQKFPRIDGWLVVALAFVAANAVTMLVASEAPDFRWQAAALVAVHVWVKAVAGVSLAAYAIDRHRGAGAGAAAPSGATTPPPPPAEPVSMLPPTDAAPPTPKTAA